MLGDAVTHPTADEATGLPPHDYLDPRTLEDPIPLYRPYRERDPIHRAPTPGNRSDQGWWLFRYDHVLAAFRDPRLTRDFARHRDRGSRPTLPDSLRPLVDMTQGWMLNREPPEHTRLRSPVSRAFTPRVVAGVRSRLEGMVDELLAPALESGRIEVIGDFALPFSIRAISELRVALSALLRRARKWELEPGPLRYRKRIGRVLKKLPLLLER